MRKLLITAASSAVLFWSGVAYAANDKAELWLAPKTTVSLDKNTAVEFDSQARFRDRSGAGDTVYVRLSALQKLSNSLTISAGLERRSNSVAADETRFLQQLAMRSGIWRGRFRFEQRFVEGGRTGLRIRGRAGVAVPLGREKQWQGFGDAEAMFTLRAPSRSGADGFTGLRTQLGISRKLSRQATISLAYLRNQERRLNAPDAVGHAPIIGLDLAL